MSEMDAKQYLKAIAKAAEEYRKNLEAIDRVWAMNHPNTKPPVSPEKTAKTFERLAEVGIHPAPVASNGFVLSRAVKDFLIETPENVDISQPTILKRLVADHPDIKSRIEHEQFKAQIAGMLTRMFKKEKLERIKESHGSEPAVYRKKAGVDI